jgi:hypothetical protein
VCISAGYNAEVIEGLQNTFRRKAPFFLKETYITAVPASMRVHTP